MYEKLKLCETRKLHYGEYLYKLVLSNSLNIYFRSELQKNGKLSYARENLDRLTDNFRNNIPLTRKIFRSEVTVPIDDYFDALDLYKILKTHSDYKIRVDPYMHLTLFSNNKSLLVQIANKLRSSAKEFWEPAEQNVAALKSKENIIFVKNKPEFEIKVWFNNKTVPSEFANWLRANRDKSRIGDIALHSIEDTGFVNGFYMFVRDEKVLNMVSLLIGHAVRRIDKLVYSEDKY
jgi:hypothetical protein